MKTNAYFRTAKQELLDAIKDVKHPFRYFTMATIGINHSPRLRTVVLREVQDDLALTIYTDKRSKKVTHLKENNNVCLLFFNHNEMLQLKVDGKAFLEADEKIIQHGWKQVKVSSKKDYSTSRDPGTKIKDPEMIEYLENVNHFAIIHIIPSKIEYLQLKKDKHIRVLYAKEPTGWEGTFLVP
ncbi:MULTISPECIES: pyridoxamine 5'-phosphate oxidase family protein [Galbibacter]|uniref:Pyridoxamine 5'-phosphate oxidase family protein n=1 Tax=Galbibacter pacificus TaxID=2996052 RepID=A0ABT6FVB4_9FLAO|nr:pyridoxamine 5'-phosphate oxidase family protein [Galbibacter pacificus]MDG3583872.1 pyridoxamine 5'-phosphate oxidase family protein [Galbibacter pacificus]MDG3587210.1 pyridoxamine 5'-phosphate oxidase family protein [Galbibacter pacificus]